MAQRRRKSFVYVCALITLMVYAVPRLPRLQHGIAGSFALLWILFACLALAANLYFLVGADKERSKQLSARNMHVMIPNDDEVSNQGMKRSAL